MKIRYIIEPDGQIFRETVYPPEKMNVDQAIVDELTRESVTTIRGVFAKDNYGLANLTKHHNQYLAAVYPRRLVLDAPFMMHQGHMVPVFKGPNASSRMRLEWKPPEGMGLVLAMSMTCTQGSGFMWELVKSWLFAVDSKKCYYRLPLGNVFEDAGLCLGNFYVTTPTLKEVVDMVITQFETAPYNADLAYHESSTVKMFRFAPEGSGFRSVPPEGEWQALCQLVSVDIQKYL